VTDSINKNNSKNNNKSNGLLRNRLFNKTFNNTCNTCKSILKITGILLLVFVFLTAFAGCILKSSDEVNDKNTGVETGNYSGTGKETGDAQNDAQQEDNGEFPLTVVDGNGVEVEIEKKPQKIVSLTLSTDEMLLSLVDKDRLAALSYLSEDPGLSNVAEEVKDIKKTGLEVETLIAMQPDLVIVADWSDGNTIKQLRDANITVYAMTTPGSISEVKDAVMKVAQLVGEKDKGQEIIQWMDGKLKSVEDKVKTLEDNQKLKVLSYNNFFCTHGIGTTFDDITKHAGVINIAAEQGMEMWQEISKEKIVELNPDAIFLPAWSYEGFDAEEFAENFKNDKSLAEINAIRNNMVFCLPEAHMGTTSQYIVLGVEDVARSAYPELFE
jgi:iron complex transport system substrate-binding protein